MLDYFCHMTIQLLQNLISGVKTSSICYLLRKIILDAIRVIENLYKAIDKSADLIITS